MQRPDVCPTGSSHASPLLFELRAYLQPVRFYCSREVEADVTMLVYTQAHSISLQGLLIGPFMLSFESTCSDMERPFMFATKIVHLESWPENL